MPLGVCVGGGGGRVLGQLWVSMKDIVPQVWLEITRRRAFTVTISTGDSERFYITLLTVIVLVLLTVLP